MGQDDLEGTEDMGTEGQDSTVLRDLRRQLKEQKAKLASFEVKEESFNRVRETLAENLLVEAGYPKLKEDVLEKIEGIPSKDDIDAFLEVRGLVRQGQATDASQETEPAEPPPSVTDVAGLGQQVAAAAQRNVVSDLDTKIAEAQSVDALDAVMAAAGLKG
jgi:hypothetical protein